MTEATALGAPSAHFTHYLDNQSLPISHAEVRQGGEGDLLVSLVSHLPSDGNWFDAIEDLIISIVMKSDHSSVTRDVGLGPESFLERPGCILVTPPRTPSYWYFDGNPLVLHLSVPSHHFHNLTGYSGAELQNLLMEAARVPLYDPLVSQLTSRMWASMESKDDGSPLLAFHALGTILSLVLSATPRRDRIEAVHQSVQPLAQWRLQRVLRHMATHLEERTTIDELARLVDLSPDHFLRSFSATTGATPYQWQSALLIEEAKRLMHQTDASLTDIALSLGFSSSAHFSTRFKQLVGLSPRAWRSSFAIN